MFGRKQIQTKDVSDEEVIDACRAFHASEAGDLLRTLGRKYPPKVVLAKIEQMVRRGLVNYGVSPWTAWAEEQRK